MNLEEESKVSKASLQDSSNGVIFKKKKKNGPVQKKNIINETAPDSLKEQDVLLSYLKKFEGMCEVS